MSHNLCIPLSIDFNNQDILGCEDVSLEQSIGNMLDLIVFTPKGSFNADPDFGFEYWNHEFSNINLREFNNNNSGMMNMGKGLNDISRQQCEDSLKESILIYEPRLSNPEVRVKMDVTDRQRSNNRKSKYEMSIHIVGEIDEGMSVGRRYEKLIAFMVEPVAKRI